MNKLYLGAAYYPELWEEEEIEKDIARIKEAGLNCVRVAEFAWGRMEPKEGDFQLGWLKTVVEKLYKNGIYTVLCTPSATRHKNGGNVCKKSRRRRLADRQ